jgi:radical SAM-linked protein
MSASPTEPLNARAGAGDSGPKRRFRAAILFALRGDLRYLSHRDEMRMVERALVRAAWPLRYSRGFNPQPRLTLPLPRPVGVESESELALVDLDETREPAQLEASLRSVLPGRCALLEVIAPATRRAPQAVSATYEVELDEPHAALAGERIAHVLGASEIVVQRASAPGKRPTQIEVRRYLKDGWLAGRVLKLLLSIDQQRSARPGEILAALGIDPTVYAGRWRRVEVIWDISLADQPIHDILIED